VLLSQRERVLGRLCSTGPEIGSKQDALQLHFRWRLFERAWTYRQYRTARLTENRFGH
jgi:hypothetical protein